MSTKFDSISRFARGSIRPAAGSRSSWTAKTYCRVSPRTKTGMLMPRSETTVTAPSDQLCACRAA